MGVEGRVREVENVRERERCEGKEQERKNNCMRESEKEGGREGGFGCRGEGKDEEEREMRDGRK